MLPTNFYADHYKQQGVEKQQSSGSGLVWILLIHVGALSFIRKIGSTDYNRYI